MADDTPPSAGIDGDILETLYQLSQRYHSHGLYEPAVRLLDFLLRHDPMHAGYHFALGKALHGHSQHGKAVQSYRCAVGLGLPDIDAHLYLGQCLIFTGRFREAAEALRQFVALAPLQASSDRLALQLRRANHLLDQIIIPRLKPAGSRRQPPGMPSENAAPSMAPRQEPMESTR